MTQWFDKYLDCPRKPHVDLPSGRKLCTSCMRVFDGDTCIRCEQIMKEITESLEKDLFAQEIECVFNDHTTDNT